MKPRHAWWIASGLGILLSGCHSASRSSYELPTSFFEPQARLLFDSQPAYFNAERYTARAPWLSTPGFKDLGESVRYRERYYDRQGHHHLPHHDYFIRSFSSVRVGAGLR